MPERPNILFVFPDQLRADCIGRDPNALTASNGDPFVETPNLNHLADTGTLFTRSYSPAPTCVPARRCLWTGQRPATCGVNWDGPWEFEHSLPGELSAAGYQTQLVGKSHSQPPRKEFGFDQMDLHTGLSSWDISDREDEYTHWLDEQVDDATEVSHGLSRNTIDGRPWHLEEDLHPTNWTTARAIRFLETRDESRPFFLHLGYMRPHQPWDPPQPYYDMYADRELPPPTTGEWTDEVYGDIRPSYIQTGTRGETPNPWCVELTTDREHRARAAYFGLVTHVDRQLRRVTKWLEIDGALDNTVIVVASDHGEMLGDHHLWFKSYGYEGSARVPLVVRFPPSRENPFESGSTIDRPVGLEDLMPTLLETANVPVPETVDGQSLLDLGRSDQPQWREYYHGEHAPTYHPSNTGQYLVSEDTKYIWNPVTGDELLFDLDADPRETTNVAGDRHHQEELQLWRDRLIDELRGRPEGFTDGSQLRPGEADFDAGIFN